MVFKCKMCGGNLEVVDGQKVATCEYCDSVQTVPSIENEKKINLYNRANNLRIKNEFDQALLIYQLIINEFPEDAEAYWGVCLCKYGIEYVDDYKTGKKVPTCHRTLFDSIFSDADYLETIKYADFVARKIYQEEAAEIDRLQKNILMVSKKEEPYDIFICYKETDERGERTNDSVFAYEIYEKLIEKGYKVFYARVTLEAKLGFEYEPIIFAALQSAKVMLAIGTKIEYFNAVWVKNEWKRFISFMNDTNKKYLIPCYKDIDVYDMPDEFLSFQSQDMSKIGYLQDLIHGIDKIFERDKPTVNVSSVQNSNLISSYFQRLDKCLAERKFDQAQWILEEIFALNQEDAKAYFYKILITKRYTSVNILLNSFESLDNDENYLMALKFAEQEYKDELISYANTIKKNIYTRQYQKALNLMETEKYDEAIRVFEEISFFKDSKDLIVTCQTHLNERKYKLAISMVNKFDFDGAMTLLKELGDYKNSIKMIEDVKCEKIIYRTKKIIINAINELNSFKFNSAIKELQTISHYKEVPSLIKQYQREYELKKQTVDKEKKKTKIIKLCIICGIISLILYLLLDTFVIAPSTDYNKAMEHLENGEYDAAYKIFGDTKWKDSKEQYYLLKAYFELEDYSDYNEAIKYVCSIGGTANINYTCDKGTFSKTHDSIRSTSEFLLPQWKCDGYHLTDWDIVDFSMDNSNLSINITFEPVYELTIFIINVNTNNSNDNYNVYANIKDEITITNPSKIGYEFLGWTGGVYVQPVKDLVIPAGTVYEDLYLTANWEPISYNIVYHLSGGTTSNPLTYTIEDDFILSKAIKDGYEFSGWFTTNEYKKEVSSISHVTGDMELYAKFSANTYSYELDANGGTLENPIKTIKITYEYLNGNNPDVIECKDGGKIPFKMKTSGTKKIIGWYTDAGLFNEFNFNEVVTEDITLYAKWKDMGYELLSDISKPFKMVFSNGSSETVDYTYTYIVAASGTISGGLKYTFTTGSPSEYSTSTIYVSIYNQTKGVSVFSGNAEKYYKSFSEYAFTEKNFDVSENDVISVRIKVYGAAANSLYYPKLELTINSPSMQIPTSTATVSLPSEVESYDIECVFNDKVVLPTPVREGYTFKGWQFDGVLITELDIKSWELFKSGTLIAIWE